jgi:hypothetical protein
MRIAAISLLIALGIPAGLAAGAENPTPIPAPAPTLGSDAYCMRRDISPEDYAKNCITQNGPAHRHVIGGNRGQSKSGAGSATR